MADIPANFFFAYTNTVSEGSNQTSYTQRVAVREPWTVLIAHVYMDMSSAAVPAAPTISDSLGHTWSLLSSVTHLAGGANGQRHEVYWAVIPNRCVLTVTATLNATINFSAFNVTQIMGADVISPKDLNANALKTESHTASATSSVSGVSTDDSDCVVLAFYGSRSNTTNPGTPSGYTQIYDNSASDRLKLLWQKLTSPLSSASVAFTTATNDGSMILVALRRRTQRKKCIRWMQGFDQYAAAVGNSDTDGANMSNINSGQNAFLRFSSGSWSLVTGRDGAGKAIEIHGVNSGATPVAARVTSSKNAGFGVSGGNGSTFLGQNNILDGEHVFFGMNVKIGSSLGASFTDGRIAVLSFQGATDRLTLTFDSSTREWGITLNPATSSVGSPSTVTPDMTAAPSFDPWQQWVWIEIHLYRDATNGRVEVWQEQPDAFGPGHMFPPSPLYLGLLPPRYVAGDPLHWSMEKIFDYTGDTSVATIGAIDSFAIIGDNRGGSTNWAATTFDDIVYSTGDRIGQPCYIKNVSPDSDVSTSGWAPSTGSSHFGVLDEVPYDSADYLAASSGNPRDVIGYSAGIGYTPKAVYALQVEFGIGKVSGSTRECGIAIISSGSEMRGPNQQITTVQQNYALACAENDPHTKAGWSYSAALAASAVIDVPSLTGGGSAQNLDAEGRIFWAGKQILATIEQGDGAAGGGDNPIYGTGLYGSGLHPVPQGMANMSGLLHPIEQGIMNP